ncbi:MULTISPECIES: YcjX family protein [Roseomonadaceae]|uniref:YcjX family protein n=1 Tax=Falsiroseomonas oleicola TaxID=2801474 RepID=A0ABS6HHT2_9PROT|nr:YcjX family protein [Roseomonas oleicola]MBU8547031.1 YcjX family protein [Roseomonas oleicola]
MAILTPLEDALAGMTDAARALAGRERVRLAVTGLSRAGKTVFLTSLVANLLAAGAGVNTLPALAAASGNRLRRARLVPPGIEATPRFDAAAHLEALAADPPRWPERTEDLSTLEIALDLAPASWLGQARGWVAGERRVTLELLDYPGEWLLDLPMLDQSYSDWSRQTLSRLRQGRRAAAAADFLQFVDALPAQARDDEALARQGFRLYRAALLRCRDELGFRFLQPGRALNPGPRGEAPLLWFFPLPSGEMGDLGRLLARRHTAYLADQRTAFFEPFFRRFRRQAVLVDALGALHAGEEAFDDTAAALSAIAQALRRGGGWLNLLTGQGVQHVGFAATKADHVPAGSRDALVGLLGDLIGPGTAGPGAATTSVHAIASLRCTQDDMARVDGRDVQAVRGVLLEGGRSARIYPGEVPDRRPGHDFWRSGEFRMPVFRPPRLAGDGLAGMPHLGLDRMLASLIGDLL